MRRINKRDRVKELGSMDAAQRLKKLYTNAIPFDRGISIKLTREAANYDISIPIKLSYNIFHLWIYQRMNIKMKVVLNAGT